MSPSRKGVRVFAPASVANFGVGFDALGAALDGPGDVVVARPSRRKGVRVVSITGDGGRLPRDPERNTASVAAAEILSLARKGGSSLLGIDLEIEKGLPLESGLGSSAASAAAGGYAALLLAGIADKKKALRAALLGEHAADGSWHGDNVFASLLGGLVLVPSSRPEGPLRPVVLPVPEGLRLVLIHPDLTLKTSESRKVLPAEVSLAQSVRQGAAFASLVAALAAGDLKAAGRAIDSDAIVEPARAKLIPGHAAVTRAMRRAGAYGCAIAGAGPSLLALSDDSGRSRDVAHAAVAAWKAEGVNATGAVYEIDRAGARHLGGA
jgi:homoserine kinase